ncbi:arsenate reductase ArsC [Methanobacterium sp. ACI-7]|uniref:arsenate reductase ArsC n=1 Tax=unclassified Methanobacterium TaxID=2627676 RepID=UPI0039C49B98
MTDNSKRVLFICKNNSGRSQMAEGLLKRIYSHKYEVCSAGSDPKGVNPLTIEVMAEIGIDISNQSSDHIKEYEGQEFDYVVTLCEDGSCPIFLSGKKYVHYEFKDPATYSKDNMEKIGVFRIIRDEIKDWIENSFVNHID